MFRIMNYFFCINIYADIFNNFMKNTLICAILIRLLALLYKYGDDLLSVVTVINININNYEVLKRDHYFVSKIYISRFISTFSKLSRVYMCIVVAVTVRTKLARRICCIALALNAGALRNYFINQYIQLLRSSSLVA